MTAKEALLMICNDSQCPALSYAVAYAVEALKMSEVTREFRVQCLYVLNNITGWRAGKKSHYNKLQIADARIAMKKAAGVLR